VTSHLAPHATQMRPRPVSGRSTRSLAWRRARKPFSGQSTCSCS